LVIPSSSGRQVWEKALDIYAEVIMKLEESHVPHLSVVVGDGPARLGLRALLPNALFLGSLSGPELARAYASSDVFLFPSHTVREREERAVSSRAELRVGAEVLS
jgi:phosphatidylinositol alpha 1,6-mannosyltransferase